MSKKKWIQNKFRLLKPHYMLDRTGHHKILSVREKYTKSRKFIIDPTPTPEFLKNYIEFFLVPL